MRQRAVVLEHVSPNLIERPSPNNQRQSDDAIGEDDRGPQQCDCVKRFPHCQAVSQETHLKLTHKPETLAPSYRCTSAAAKRCCLRQKALLP
jgi:hypothetical protein